MVAVCVVEAGFQVSLFSFTAGSTAVRKRQETASLMSLESGNVVPLALTPDFQVSRVISV